MSQTYVLNVYNTLTGKYEETPVTEDVYRCYKRTNWNIDDNNASFFDHETQFSQLIGGDDGAYEDFHEFVSESNPTEQAVLQSIQREQLLEMLPLLDDKEREVIDLLYFKGLSAAEAGRSLGISERAVNKRKQSAFKRIRAEEKFL